MTSDRDVYRIRDSIDTFAAADSVMRRVLDPYTWTEWQSEIKRVKGPSRIAQGDQVTGDAELVGFKVQGKSDAKTVNDALFVEDVIVGVRMVVTYEVTPNEQGARITRTLEADLPAGVAGGVLSILLRAKLRRMQKKLLQDLKDQAEADA
ncbi:MAG: Polyketide cyclase / dehydrase and lipid transport [Actinomycetota bacterium]|jgi:hypothetical protein|nr:Polyketide cyclase / dehydrase and lipid transport [Actinomycetota bacterium]